MIKNIFLFIALSIITFSANSQNLITGQVFDNETQKTLENVAITVLESSNGTYTDGNGNFKLTNLHNGKVKLKFALIGYKQIVKTLHINKGKQDSLNFKIYMEKSVIEAEEIVVSGGYHSTQHENALKIELMSADKINSVGSQNFTEALTSIPGVDMISRGSGVSRPVIRGLSLNEVLILKNGMRIENQQWSPDHPLGIDENGISKVEIIKGPASLLYGSDAIGGVINILSEKPATQGTVKGDFSTQYHSNTKGIHSNFGIKASGKKINAGIRIGGKSNADYRQGNGCIAPNTRFNEYSGKANFGFHNRFLSSKIFYDFINQKLGMCVPPVIAEKIYYISGVRKNDRWYQNLNNHIVTSKNLIFFDKLKFEVNASYQHNIRQLFTEGDNPAIEMNLNTLSYEIKSFLPSKKNNEYIVGLQGIVQTNRNKNERPVVILPDADVNEISGFAFAKHVLFEKLNLQAGARYDKRFITIFDLQNEIKINPDFGNFSGSAGATYNLNKKILFRVNFASAYRSPNIAELSADGIHGSRYEKGSENLEPERNFEKDFSSHIHFTHFSFDFAVFDNTINNYIYLNPTENFTPDGYKIYEYSQTKAHLYGGEVGLHLHPHIAHWLHVVSTYSQVTGVQGNGNYLPFIPSQKLKANIKTEAKKLKFMQKPYLKLDFVYSFKQTQPAMFETETNEYYLLNFASGFSFDVKKYKFSFGFYIRNILNQTYYDHLSTLKPLEIYNQGRNVSVSLKINF